MIDATTRFHRGAERSRGVASGYAGAAGGTRTAGRFVIPVSRWTLLPDMCGRTAAGVSQLGWIEGRNLLIDAHYGPEEQVSDRAAELVRSAPDVIVVYRVPATRAVQRSAGGTRRRAASGRPGRRAS
jgi:hypothetical protein